MLDPVKNWGKVSVDGLYNQSAVTVNVVSGDGARLPNPSTDGAFNLVWFNSTDYSDPADDPEREIVRCTNKSGDQLTVVRPNSGNDYNGEGSDNVASIKNRPGKNYKMFLGVTKKTIDDITDGLSDNNYTDSDKAKVDSFDTFTQALNSQITGETPTGSIDGTNTTFTLANTPTATSLKLYLNGQRLTLAEDYTLSGDTITMFTAPELEDMLRVDYNVAGDGSGINADTLDGKEASEFQLLSSGGWAVYTGAMPTVTQSDVNGVDTISFTGDVTDTFQTGEWVKIEHSTQGMLFFKVKDIELQGGNTIMQIVGEISVPTAGSITSISFSKQYIAQGCSPWENKFKFRLVKSGNQTLPDNVMTKVQNFTKEYDFNNNCGNHTYTAPVSGFFFINASIFIDVPTYKGAVLTSYLIKNSTGTNIVDHSLPSGNYNFRFVTSKLVGVLYLSRGDVVSVNVNLDTIDSSTSVVKNDSFLAGHFIGI